MCQCECALVFRYWFTREHTIFFNNRKVKYKYSFDLYWISLPISSNNYHNTNCSIQASFADDFHITIFLSKYINIYVLSFLFILSQIQLYIDIYSMHWIIRFSHTNQFLLSNKKILFLLWKYVRCFLIKKMLSMKWKINAFVILNSEENK